MGMSVDGKEQDWLSDSRNADVCFGRRCAMEIHLSEAEREFLVDVLEERHLALQREIRHTDHREFKNLLHQRLEMLETLLDRVNRVELTVK